jgi:hypothetical protein
MPKLTLLNDEIVDGFFVDMFVDSDVEDRLISSGFSQISIIDSLVDPVSFVNLKMMDGTGQTINDKIISPDETIQLKFGKNMNNYVLGKFKLSTSKYLSDENTSSNSIIINSTLISDKWDALMKKTYNRAWRKVRYSDVVKIIADEIGITITDIEETEGIYTVIQPNWTNNQLLKWLVQQSKTTEGNSGYFYTINLDGKFIFKTYHTAFSKKPVKRLEHYYKNITDQKGYTNLLIDNSYMPTLIRGGFGVESIHFDYEQKKWIESDSVIDQYQERQLSDWYYIDKNHIEPSRVFYGGRNTDNENVTKNKVIDMANSVHKVQLHVEGDASYNVTDIINLIVLAPKFDTDQQTTINESYSGYWMIWKIAHLLDNTARNYITQLFLMRSGINSVNNKNFVKTLTGKDIT